MSHDEATMISGKLDKIWRKLNDLDVRVAVIESRQRPDAACQKYVERKCVAIDQFDQLHRDEHDADRDRVISWGRVIQIGLLGLVTVTQFAVLVATFAPQILGG